MGTNYYLKLKNDFVELGQTAYVMRDNKIQELKEKVFIDQERYRHIGKKSLGCPFIMRTCDEWKNYDEFKDFLNKHEGNYIILNEYNDQVELEDLEGLIEMFDEIEYEERWFS